jgi:2-haloacid dehalogenase
MPAAAQPRGVVIGYISRSTGQPIKAVLFDTFGTVVDWRTGVAREVRAFLDQHNIDGVDPWQFADAWRARYQAAMQAVRDGDRDFVPLDVLHLENLRVVLAEFRLPTSFAPEELWQLNTAWHRLDPWPDSIDALAVIRRQYLIGPLSNGNLALLVNMAKRAGLPWDVVIGADVTRVYKPLPAAYTTAAELLGLPPSAVMLVAAHNSDLVAARAAGLATAFVLRPTEHGPNQTTDLAAAEDWDIAGATLTDVAERLTTDT